MEAGVITKSRIDAKSKPGLVMRSCASLVWRLPKTGEATMAVCKWPSDAAGQSRAISAPSLFLDDPGANHADDPAEHEANQWAGDWLIPPQYTDELPGLHTKAAVSAFAAKIGIHAGIILGRLQHEGYVPFATPMNDLRQSLRFAEPMDL
jgi:hypothetical protein